jgi:hypothetical protein
MLLHWTKRLAEKLPHEHFRNAATTVSQDKRMPLREWHGHLFLLDRRQCVLFCQDLTRWPALFMTVRREIGKPVSRAARGDLRS